MAATGGQDPLCDICGDPGHDQDGCTVDPAGLQCVRCPDIGHATVVCPVPDSSPRRDRQPLSKLGNPASLPPGDALAQQGVVGGDLQDLGHVSTVYSPPRWGLGAWVQDGRQDQPLIQPRQSPANAHVSPGNTPPAQYWGQGFRTQDRTSPGNPRGTPMCPPATASLAGGRGQVFRT